MSMFALKNTESTVNQTAQNQNTDANVTTQDKKGQLRGLSFADGERALDPNGGEKTTETTPKSDKKVDRKGPPPEIKALRLRKVKVECSMEAWEALSETERQGVLTFLQKKENECVTQKGLKSSKVTISMGKSLEAVDEKTIEANEKDAADNIAQLNEGKGPTAGHGVGGKTIGVKEGDVHVTQNKTEKITKVPVRETKVMNDHFDAAGSTFDSADYKPEDMQQSGVIALLDQAAQKILEYLEMDPEATVTLTVVASESHVPNPAQFKEKGSLAAARAANGVELAKAHFAAAGIDLSHVSFTTQNLGANGPDWDPKLGKHNAIYTEHQFVRLDVEAEVEVDGEGTEEVVETEISETKTQDAELVKMSVLDDRKSGRSKIPKKHTVRPHNHRPKRTKKKRSGKKKKSKFKTVKCPTW